MFALGGGKGGDGGKGGRFHHYANDEEAAAAEQRIVAAMGAAEKYADPTFGGNSALYCDWTRPPLGFLPADSVRWGRICDLGVKDMLQPVLVAAATASSSFSSSSTISAIAETRPGCQQQLVQGALPNTWLVNAMAAVASKPELLRAVFVSSKNWLRGIHTLRFFKNGQWVYVHVDDCIPLDRDRAPLYCRSEDPNEYWPLVLEKAYAKLHRCYENLSHGTLEYALSDLTGRTVAQHDVVAVGPSIDVAAFAVAGGGGIGGAAAASGGDGGDGGGGGGGGAKAAAAAQMHQLFKQLTLDLAADAVVAASYQPVPGAVLRPLEGVLVGQAYVVEETAFFEPGETGTNPAGGPVRVAGVADMQPTPTAVQLVRLRSAWCALEAADAQVAAAPASSDDVPSGDPGAGGGGGGSREGKRPESKQRDQGDASASEAADKEPPPPLSGWRGAWSVGHAGGSWGRYPEIWAALRPDALARRTRGAAFWVSWADFCRLFNRVCSAPGLAARSLKVFAGEWNQAKPRSSPGGCPLFHTFAANPQFCFATEQETALTITLRQPDARFVEQRREYANGLGLLVAGLRGGGQDDGDDVYGPNACRLPEFAPERCDVRLATETFRRQRDITVTVTVDPGRYVVVPMTYRPQQQTFLLEVSYDRVVAWEHDNDSPDPPPAPPPPTAAEVKRRKRLAKQQRLSGSGGGGSAAAAAAALTARRWVLEEEQHFDVEDEGRPLQMLHREVAFLLKEVTAVRADMRRMDQQVQALRSAGGGPSY